MRTIEGETVFEWENDELTKRRLEEMRKLVEIRRRREEEAARKRRERIPWEEEHEIPWV